MPSPDIVIAGAGLVGLACALECQRRGLRVTVLEKGRAGQEASWAAAGMLAAHDPANPAALAPLSELSLALYPGFLEYLRDTSGATVPIETEWTLEAGGDVSSALFGLSGFRRIAEQSLNPRILMAAVYAAVRQTDILLLDSTPVQSIYATTTGVEVRTPDAAVHCRRFLDCTGAWSTAHVRPAKGQMLRLHAPGALAAGSLGNVVVRTHEIYLVPRLDGSVVIGATVEDAGFDKTLHAADLQQLCEQAAKLIPAMLHAPLLESWAGLRPATADQLPLIGSTGPGTYIAAGHFRNGILLAPATARVAAQMLLDEQPDASMAVFDPDRFTSDKQAAAQATGAVFAQT
ncbi:MAG: FAD-dependent oxidoreductase [Janthinobacterium lividum]